MPSIPCPLPIDDEQQQGEVELATCTSTGACSSAPTTTEERGFQWVRPSAGAPACALDDSYLKSLLNKWDLRRHACLLSYHYPHKHYHKMQGAALALDLFNDPEFQAAFQVAVKGGGSASLGSAVSQVELETVPATVLRMDLFDRLSSAEPAIVRSNGSIVKRMDDVREGYQVSDMLREMLLCEESDNAELYSEAERSELLFKIFEHLALGGACCQFEDSVEPYMEATKKMYKELVSVQKNNAGKMEVASAVYLIKSIQTDGGVSLFPSDARTNLCILAVDPLRRIAKLWYSAFVSWW